MDLEDLLRKARASGAIVTVVDNRQNPRTAVIVVTGAETAEVLALLRAWAKADRGQSAMNSLAENLEEVR
jgi:xanthine/CO dehydrogenase XdhC/CoxF family maturation factor